MQNTIRLSVWVLAFALASCSGGEEATDPTPDEVAPEETAGNEDPRLRLPMAQPEFAGTIELRATDSEVDFPAEVHAPEGAPNILLIMPDDVGFGATSAFGGPIPTPSLQRIADAGVRYNRFHTTALCSPTRAALIAGRNHHSVATGVIMEGGTGFPGYNSLVPRSAGTVAQVLLYNGYNTAWYGKNHNVPDWQSSQVGPFDLWPTGLGFEQFFGFIGGDTSQFTPAIFDGTRPVEPPTDDPDYHLDVDMADRAIGYIREQHALAPDKPLFIYYAPGTAHAPHHAPTDWIERFRGQFDQGWDAVRAETHARQIEMGVIPADTVLTERTEGIPAWDSLSDDQRRVYARMMEVYAAALAHMDFQVGRILDAVEATGEMDNTLVIYLMGDNGASAEGSPQGLLNEMTFFNNIEVPFETVLARIDELGGPTTFGHYPIGWAHAMDTPLQWAKQVASHFGGTRNGLAISWPAHMEARGEIRTQFHHVIDIMPTILEAVGVPAPISINGIEQQPIEGVSMIYSFDDADAPSTRTTQYFEMFANRAIYHEGWVACTTPPIAPWVATGTPPDVEEYEWELYNIDEDFSQANNLASEEPERLAELQALFLEEARRYNVLPLDNRKIERMAVENRPSLTAGRTEFTYYPGMVRIPEGTAPDFKNKSFTITAAVDLPNSQESGMIVTQGGRFGGWALYLMNGRPTYVYNYADVERYRVQAPSALTPGEHEIRLQFAYDGGGPGLGGQVTIFVDGEQVVEGRVEHTMGYRISLDETFDIGADMGEPVHEEYEVPFHTGAVRRVDVRLEAE